MPTRNKIAVCCGDLHLSLLQPACRADKDWKGVQAHYLRQLKEVAGKLPIIAAGDIFDKPKPSPEEINFALRELPDGMLCVPGQHDLPSHRIDLMEKSGYGVLKETDKIIDISGTCHATKDFVVWGFGWEQEILPASGKDGRVNIAAIHRYCWMEGKSFPNPPPDSNVAAFRKQLKGYDIAVYGDNHKFFETTVGDCKVFNSGGFIRRKSDEIYRKPSIGIIYSDGTIERHKLDTTIDKFHDIEGDREEVPLNMKEFIDGLEKLGEHGLDFREAVKNHLESDEIEPETKEIIIRALDAPTI